MAASSENFDIVNSLDSRWSPTSVEVVSERQDPSTDLTVVDLQIQVQTNPVATPPLPPPDPKPVPTEIGRVDYFV